MDNKVKIGVISLISVIILGIAVFMIFKNDSKTNQLGKNDEKIKSETGKEITYTETYQSMLDNAYNGMKDNKSFKFENYNVYDLVHWISNPVITAKENKKIGFIEPSPQNIDKLIVVVEKSDISHKKFFLETLEKWKKGDFVDVVDMHNTAWKMLDGNIGKAKGPDEYEINNLKEKYYK